MKSPLILIIDDDEAVRQLIESQIRSAGYRVVSACNGLEALALLRSVSPDLVIADLCMPDVDGLDFLAARRKQEHAENSLPLGVIMLTGRGDVQLCVRAMQLGALDFLVKPVGRDALLAAVEKDITVQRERVTVWTREQQNARSLELQAREISELSRDNSDALEETLNSLVNALDARERETRNHSQRVSRYALHLAQEMGLSASEREIVRRGGLLHDIGKIGLADHILLKPGPLTAEEMQEMRKHTETGSTIVRNLSNLVGEAEIILSHHERYDGSGYPQGLRGKEIPLAARIFAIIDSFDAITSDRPYRPARSYSEAAAEIAANAGTQFDPEVVRAFLAVPSEVWARIADEVTPGETNLGAG